LVACVDDRRRDDIGAYPGATRRIGDEQVQRVLVMTLETTPTDATHWSTRSLAKQVGDAEGDPVQASVGWHP